MRVNGKQENINVRFFNGVIDCHKNNSLKMVLSKKKQHEIEVIVFFFCFFFYFYFYHIKFNVLYVGSYM